LVCIFTLSRLIDISSAATIPCGSRDDGPDPTLCKNAVSGGGDPLPNCMNTGESDENPTWVCSQCSHNCDCPEGMYCPKGPGQFSGSCRVTKLDDRIGGVCTDFGIPGHAGWVEPQRGINDWLVCGIGSCEKGICRECSGGPILWDIDMSTERLRGSCSAVAHPPIDQLGDRDAYLARDGGSLACRGSYCKSGIITREKWWVYNAIPETARIATAAFTGLIFFLLLGWSAIIVVMKCVSAAGSKRKRRREYSAAEIADEFEIIEDDDNKTLQKRRPSGVARRPTQPQSTQQSSTAVAQENAMENAVVTK
jgi:hypothetical protein